MRTEDERARRLLAAQASAVALFDEVVARGIIAPGRGEQAVSDQIRDLANEMFGKTRHWHKRIVRSGPHTLFPYRENPPDRVIEADDIVFADFGPVFESYIAPGNTTVMRRRDKAGRVCHWILEIHLTDTARRFGGFYEQLLDLG